MRLSPGENVAHARTRRFVGIDDVDKLVDNMTMRGGAHTRLANERTLHSLGYGQSPPTEKELVMEQSNSMPSSRSESMQACIHACTRCHHVCLQNAMTHCLATGGKQVEPDHFRLLMNCAEICQASANFQLTDSVFSSRLCTLCAEVCEACATSCRGLSDMADCASACDACASSCRSMAAKHH